MDYTKYPTTRAEAKAQGKDHYFTGQPCKHGHITLRKTKGACIECLKVDWQKSNEKRAEYFAQYNQSDAGKESKRRYYEANKDVVIARAQARPDEQKRQYKKKHKITNPDLYKELVSLRRRRFRDATPQWLTPDQKMEIRLKYRLAIELSRKTGVRHAVDHVIPIMGSSVCGLHVPWNLDVITQGENLKKYNKLLDAPEPA